MSGDIPVKLNAEVWSRLCSLEKDKQVNWKSLILYLKASIVNIHDLFSDVYPANHRSVPIKVMCVYVGVCVNRNS